jgi:transposase
LGLDRRTVGRYRQWATEQQLLTDPLPALEDLQQHQADTLPDPRPPQTVSAVEPYRDLVVQWRQQGVEMAAIHQRLREQGFAGSYSAVQRFVYRLEPSLPEAVVRVERAPGEEGQVDFGHVGTLIDPATGKLRTAWVFVMTLSWCMISRHRESRYRIVNRTPVRSCPGPTPRRIMRSILVFFSCLLARCCYGR